jgi:hypothetical protein
MQRRLTFSMRGLLIAIAVIAVLLVAVPAVYRQHEWSETREMLNEWAAGLERKANHFESWGGQLSSGKWIFVGTAECKKADNFGAYTFAAGTPVRKQGFYVVPPGIWVETIDDVIQTWEEFD